MFLNMRSCMHMSVDVSYVYIYGCLRCEPPWGNLPETRTETLMYS